MTLLERLKTETRLAHDRIEAAVDVERRITSQASYRALLARFYGFHAAWEPQAAALIADPAFFEPRRKATRLASDLRFLGVSDHDLDRLPRCTPLMPMADAAAAFGALYVIEGSTLGGAIIARHVERGLGFTSEAGCSYFRSYGPDLGPMWKAFGHRLLALSDPAFDARAIASANRTFETMRIWLSEETASKPRPIAEALEAAAEPRPIAEAREATSEPRATAEALA